MILLILGSVVRDDVAGAAQDMVLFSGGPVVCFVSAKSPCCAVTDLKSRIALLAKDVASGPFSNLMSEMLEEFEQYEPSSTGIGGSSVGAVLAYIGLLYSRNCNCRGVKANGEASVVESLMVVVFCDVYSILNSCNLRGFVC